MRTFRRTYEQARSVEETLTAISRTRALTESESQTLEDAIRDQGRYIGTRKRRSLHLVIG